MGFRALHVYGLTLLIVLSSVRANEQSSPTRLPSSSPTSLASVIPLDSTRISTFSWSSGMTRYSSTDLLFDPLDYFEISNEFCFQKSVCSKYFYQSFPDKNCYCDELCSVMGDCCKNFNTVTDSSLSKEQFACVSMNEIVKNDNYGTYIVTKCAPKWENDIIKRLCEDGTTSDDIFLSLPVSDHSSLRVMYKNMYCAQCNYVDSFDYWKAQMMCVNDTGVRSLPNMTDCDWFFIRPRPDVTHRLCQLHPLVKTTCSGNNGDNFAEFNENCTSEAQEIVYDAANNAYRNKYCAMCNGVESRLYCDQVNVYTTMSEIFTLKPKNAYSFRILVDFNQGTVSENEILSELQTCNNNEKYDAFSGKCREIYCAPPSEAINGSCVREDNRRPILTKNCTLVKLDPSEYKLTNESALFVFASKKEYSVNEFQVDGSDVFICLQNSEECVNGCGERLFQFDVAESYLTLATLIISIICLSITLIVYIIFPKLRNLPGKILISLVISLLLAQVLFLSSAEFENWRELCMSTGILVHYFYLAAFCWMNIIAFDMWMTFSNQFVSSGSRRGGAKFFKYSIYGWMIPLLIVSIAVVLDFIEIDDNYKTLKPGYGKHVCWISTRDSLLMFFAGPLALFKFFDIISFILTAVHIARARKQGAMATKKNTCSFFINLKLSLIMGLTWVFAFVANLMNEPVTWYLFIVFNCLQGLFIAMCFLCTKKVWHLMREKCRYSKSSSSGTRLTTLS